MLKANRLFKETQPTEKVLHWKQMYLDEVSPKNIKNESD
jgi:hypothetical protein